MPKKIISWDPIQFKSIPIIDCTTYGLKKNNIVSKEKKDSEASTTNEEFQKNQKHYKNPRSEIDESEIKDYSSLCPGWENKKHFEEYWRNPMFFFKNNFYCVAQRILPEYSEKLLRARRLNNYDKIKLNMFQPMEKNKHEVQISRQEWEMIYHYKRAIQNLWPKILAFCSWNGIGKSRISAFIMLHFVTCFFGAKVIYIAPRQEMARETKNFIKNLFNHCWRYKSHIEEKNNALYYWWDSFSSSIKFISTKEWIQWIHAENCLIIADEASDISDDILKSVNWLLWRWNNIFIMFWNPKYDKWFFYDTCCSNSEHIKSVHFSAEESPLIEKDYIERAKDIYWVYSDEYIRRIKWRFPKNGYKKL